MAQPRYLASGHELGTAARFIVEDSGGPARHRELLPTSPRCPTAPRWIPQRQADAREYPAPDRRRAAAVSGWVRRLEAHADLAAPRPPLLLELGVPGAQPYIEHTLPGYRGGTGGSEGSSRSESPLALSSQPSPSPPRRAQAPVDPLPEIAAQARAAHSPRGVHSPARAAPQRADPSPGGVPATDDALPSIAPADNNQRRWQSLWRRTMRELARVAPGTLFDAIPSPSGSESSSDAEDGSRPQSAREAETSSSNGGQPPSVGSTRLLSTARGRVLHRHSDHTFEHQVKRLKRYVRHKMRHADALYGAFPATLQAPRSRMALRAATMQHTVDHIIGFIRQTIDDGSDDADRESATAGTGTVRRHITSESAESNLESILALVSEGESIAVAALRAHAKVQSPASADLPPISDSEDDEPAPFDAAKVLGIRMGSDALARRQRRMSKRKSWKYLRGMLRSDHNVGTPEDSNEEGEEDGSAAGGGGQVAKEESKYYGDEAAGVTDDVRARLQQLQEAGPADDGSVASGGSRSPMQGGWPKHGPSSHRPARSTTVGDRTPLQPATPLCAGPDPRGLTERQLCELELAPGLHCEVIEWLTGLALPLQAGEGWSLSDPHAGTRGPGSSAASRGTASENDWSSATGRDAPSHYTIRVRNTNADPLQVVLDLDSLAGLFSLDAYLGGTQAAGRDKDGSAGLRMVLEAAAASGPVAVAKLTGTASPAHIRAAAPGALRGATAHVTKGPGSKGSPHLSQSSSTADPTRPHRTAVVRVPESPTHAESHDSPLNGRAPVRAAGGFGDLLRGKPATVPAAGSEGLEDKEATDTAPAKAPPAAGGPKKRIVKKGGGTRRSSPRTIKSAGAPTRTATAGTPKEAPRGAPVPAIVSADTVGELPLMRLVSTGLPPPRRQVSPLKPPSPSHRASPQSRSALDNPIAEDSGAGAAPSRPESLQTDRAWSSRSTSPAGMEGALADSATARRRPSHTMTGVGLPPSGAASRRPSLPDGGHRSAEAVSAASSLSAWPRTAASLLTSPRGGDIKGTEPLPWLAGFQLERSTMSTGHAWSTRRGSAPATGDGWGDDWSFGSGSGPRRHGGQAISGEAGTPSHRRRRRFTITSDPKGAADALRARRGTRRGTARSPREQGGGHGPDGSDGASLSDSTSPRQADPRLSGEMQSRRRGSSQGNCSSAAAVAGGDRPSSCQDEHQWGIDGHAAATGQAAAAGAAIGSRPHGDPVDGGGGGDGAEGGRRPGTADGSQSKDQCVALGLSGAAIHGANAAALQGGRRRSGSLSAAGGHENEGRPGDAASPAHQLSGSLSLSTDRSGVPLAIGTGTSTQPPRGQQSLVLGRPPSPATCLPDNPVRLGSRGRTIQRGPPQAEDGKPPLSPGRHDPARARSAHALLAQRLRSSSQKAADGGDSKANTSPATGHAPPGGVDGSALPRHARKNTLLQALFDAASHRASLTGSTPPSTVSRPNSTTHDDSDDRDDSPRWARSGLLDDLADLLLCSADEEALAALMDILHRATTADTAALNKNKQKSSDGSLGPAMPPMNPREERRLQTIARGLLDALGGGTDPTMAPAAAALRAGVPDAATATASRSAYDDASGRCHALAAQDSALYEEVVGDIAEAIRRRLAQEADGAVLDPRGAGGGGRRRSSAARQLAAAEAASGVIVPVRGVYTSIFEALEKLCEQGPAADLQRGGIYARRRSGADGGPQTLSAEALRLLHEEDRLQRAVQVWTTRLAQLRTAAEADTLRAGAGCRNDRFVLFERVVLHMARRLQHARQINLEKLISIMHRKLGDRGWFPPYADENIYMASELASNMGGGPPGSARVVGSRTFSFAAGGALRRQGRLCSIGGTGEPIRGPPALPWRPLTAPRPPPAGEAQRSDAQKTQEKVFLAISAPMPTSAGSSAAPSQRGSVAMRRVPTVPAPPKTPQTPRRGRAPGERTSPVNQA